MKKNRNEIKCINSINIKTTQITPTHTKKIMENVNILNVLY